MAYMLHFGGFKAVNAWLPHDALRAGVQILPGSWASSVDQTSAVRLRPCSYVWAHESAILLMPLHLGFDTVGFSPYAAP
jgi:hypothetical protein